MNNEYRDIEPLFETKNVTPYLDLESKYPSVIIYPPTIDWNYMKQRPQQIMEQFSLNGFEVFYCNKTQSNLGQYTIINPNLKIVHNNANFIKEVVPRLKKQGKKIILWVSWSKLHLFLDHYSPDFIIYDYLDDFAAWEAYLDPMVKKSDIIITTSEVLMDRIKREYPQKPSFIVPNGCDLNHFKPKDNSPVPAELSRHNGPVITYSGAWANWIDVSLVEKIARTYKNALISIIGTEFGTRVPRHIPNLKYFGYKSYNDLPKYLQNSTVCIIPFLINPITVATNPIKMYEYLASGSPVVSTNIPEAQNIPGVYIGKTHDSFIEQIGLIIKKQIVINKSYVYTWLESHTWERRFMDIHEIIKNYINMD
ncbi:MAG: glycosyltransferase family 1 protein [Clostridiaceae bacterium]|nr:glycosyltransferase family 1 protein [Clostridiaceae bacterium]